MDAEGFRRLALALDGGIESAHMGHPDFRVGGKIFAILNRDESLGMVRFTGEEQRHFIEKSPEVFSPCAGAWGRAGATHMRLEYVDETTLKACLELAWRKFVAN